MNVLFNAFSCFLVFVLVLAFIKYYINVRYRDFKKSLQKASGGKSTEIARQAVGSLMLVLLTLDYFCYGRSVC